MFRSILFCFAHNYLVGAPRKVVARFGGHKEENNVKLTQNSATQGDTKAPSQSFIARVVDG